MVIRNVADLVESPRPAKRTPQTLSVDQAKVFLDTLKGDRLSAFYTLAIGCGLRLGEITGLTWEAVDLNTGALSVLQSIQYLPGHGLITSEPKTEKSKRSMIMPAFAVEALRIHQQATGKKTGLIFTTANGTPFSPRNIERHFHSMLEKANLPRIRFHDLRHTFASILLNQNVHPKVVQEMLGHSTITLTLDTYSHLLPAMQSDAVEKMNKLIQP
jgi:integrase